MYIFAEPVTDEQIQEIQTQNAESVEAFQRKLQGLDGDRPDSQSTVSEEDKWADIQADVQEAMARDEMSLTDPSGDKESSHAVARDRSPEPERSEVFEDGPLYTNRSPHTVDQDDVAAAAGSDEEEVDIEEVEEDEEEEIETKEIDEDEEGGDVEIDDQEEAFEHADDPFELERDEQAQISRGNAPLEDVSEDEDFSEDEDEDEDITEVTNEHEIDEHDPGEDEVIEDELGLVDEGYNSDLNAEFDNVDHGDGENARDIQDEKLEALGQEATQEGEQPEVNVALDSEQAALAKNSSGSADGDSDIQEQPASPDDGFDTRADQPFLEEIDQAYCPAPGSEVLAMALTIRNKINGKFVQRPENIGPDDKWSIEYSLEEVPKPDRAWSLYLACQERRRRKLDGLNEKQEDDSVNYYIQHLRKLSRKGAVWREEMDKKEQGRKVVVVGQPIPEEDVSEPVEQRPEE